jgi:hypothetical protein
MEEKTMKEKRKEPKIVEEPILEINVKVDKMVDDNYQGRLNWMKDIDLEDIFRTPIKNEDPILVEEAAKRKTKMFLKRLKQYIKDKCYSADLVDENDESSQLKDMDWQNWNITS